MVRDGSKNPRQTGSIMKSSSSLQDLLARLDFLLENKSDPILVALDGRSGSGKSTLALQLAERFEISVVIQSDDFYCGGPDEQWITMTPKEKVDQCIEWQRLRAEVLEPLLAGKTAVWHPFDFKTWQGQSPATMEAGPARLIILDGAYSARPELSDLIDLAILVEAADGIRRKRLIAREGAEYMHAWHRVWDEAEDFYFTHVRPPESFDIKVMY